MFRMPSQHSNVKSRSEQLRAALARVTARAHAAESARGGAHKLREWRKLNGLSQRQLGRLIGYCQRGVSKIERSEVVPSIATAVAIGKATGGAVRAEDWTTPRPARGRRSYQARLTIGARKLQEWRVAKGVSQHRLGRAIGYHQSVVSKYELGKKLPDIATALAIAQATGGAVPIETWAEPLLPLDNWIGAGKRARGALQAKLTESDVRAIRADQRLQRELAERYGVDPSTICRIKKHQLRAYVADACAGRRP